MGNLLSRIFRGRSKGERNVFVFFPRLSIRVFYLFYFVKIGTILNKNYHESSNASLAYQECLFSFLDFNDRRLSFYFISVRDSFFLQCFFFYKACQYM